MIPIGKPHLLPQGTDISLPQTCVSQGSNDPQFEDGPATGTMDLQVIKFDPELREECGATKLQTQ